MAATAPTTPLDRAAEHFAYNQYRDWIVYTVLAERESNPEFKRILEELIGHELEDYRFWLDLSPRKTFRVGAGIRIAYRVVRRALGLTFTAKLLERREKQMIGEYRGLLDSVADPRIRAAIHRILEHENLHESRLIGQVREQKIDYLSSMVLGLNDGLIELTGALTGFAFAFRRPSVAALAGAITGISATLSMSASAYMQARHEADKDPIRAAAYTGGAYLAVVALLILPFVLIGSLYAAVAVMAAVVLAVIAGASFYSAVILERRFATQVAQMALFSVGVAGVAFVLGLLLRSATGISP